MIKNQHAVAQLRVRIEEQLRWGDPAGWTQEDLEELSDRIFAKTEVRLSVSTLKRIWGKVKYDSSPTMGTMNALARFAGYGGWRAFLGDGGTEKGDAGSVAGDGGERLADAGMIEGDEGGIVQGVGGMTGYDGGMTTGAGMSVHDEGNGMRRRWRGAWMVLLLVAIGALVILVGSRSGRRPVEGDVSAIRFECRKVTDDLPNSVVFTYDLGSFPASKVMIQQNWDTTRREEVDPRGHEHTSLYLYPGHFNARLIVDGRTVKMTEVFIETRGWKGIIEATPQPIYLGAQEIREGKGLRVSPAVMKEKLGAGALNGRVVDLSDIRDFHSIPAANFTLKMQLRNNAMVEECLCRKVRVLVLGMGTAIIVPLVDKGCISDIGVYTGCAYISGKSHDLSGFGCDFRTEQALECSVRAGRLVIGVNGRTVLDAAQPTSIGAIKGIRVEFEGGGEIRQASLEGPGGGIDLLGADVRGE